MTWEAMPHPRGATELDFVLRNGLRDPHDADGWIATLEQFYENGPVYANAIHPTDGAVRSGPMVNYDDARQWAERTVNGQAQPEGA